MRCLYPRNVGWNSDGRTICWSSKNYSKEFATFQLPCGKCIECRLEYARSWAIRCVHEAEMHPNNVFITLTYSDENLISNKLDYSHFQSFMKRLRMHVHERYVTQNNLCWDSLTKEERKEHLKNYQVGMFVTGEYGDEKKRPHWHAIIFNWSPEDQVHKYKNERGDQVYSSKILDQLWQLGITELGSVTFESAGYVARYAAKKLSHGKDGEHEYEPISKKSNKHAIGKKFLEKYHDDIFNNGFVLIESNMQKAPIPRYYIKWLEKHYPDKYSLYVQRIKTKNLIKMFNQNKKGEDYVRDCNLKRPLGKGAMISKNQVRKKIMDDRFKKLQKFKKL